MVAKNKQVKSKYLVISVNNAGGVNEGTSTLAWLLQDNITVIGWYARAKVTPDSNWDSGYQSAHTELSRAGIISQEAMLFRLSARIQCGSTTMAATVENGLIGDNENNLVTMFPEGYGIDLDDGEYLYLHHTSNNTMGVANGHVGSSMVCIYYVER
ncbi:hypothetical protein ES708_31517 [subsurface metagenome]